jgi:hypothetical protein
MIAATFILWIALVVLMVRWLRIKTRLSAARWCLWLGFFLAYVAFQIGWVPSDPITFPAVIGIFIYLVIQDLRIQAAARESKSA